MRPKFVVVSALAALILSLSSVGVARSITFAGDFPRTDGDTRTISFSGDLAGSTVTGRLAVDGQEIDVVGDLTREAVTGRFEVAGKEVGHFTAKVVGQDLHGSYDLNGEVGAWTIPLRELPREAQAVLK